MSNPYEIEHNIKPSGPSKRPRRPSMSSFFNQLSQVETETSATPERAHNNPHATPNPVEMAATVRLLEDQMRFFLSNATIPQHQEFLEDILSDLDDQIEDPPNKVAGVPQSYLDELERVDKKRLKKSDLCAICGEKFLDDPYPLVVQLPCHPTHKFDLDCVGPWLRLQGTCPLDRKELLKKKEVVASKDEEEEEDDDMMYG